MIYYAKVRLVRPDEFYIAIELSFHAQSIVEAVNLISAWTYAVRTFTDLKVSVECVSKDPLSVFNKIYRIEDRKEIKTVLTNFLKGDKNA